MAEEAKEDPEKMSSLDGGEILTISAGLFLPPLAFFLSQQIGYTLVPWVCRTGHHFVLHLLMLASLLLAASGGWVAWRYWRRHGGTWPDQGGDAAARQRFAMMLGLLTSATFALVIIAQWLPVLFVSPCE